MPGADHDWLDLLWLLPFLFALGILYLQVLKLQQRYRLVNQRLQQLADQQQVMAADLDELREGLADCLARQAALKWELAAASDLPAPQAALRTPVIVGGAGGPGGGRGGWGAHG